MPHHKAWEASIARLPFQSTAKPNLPSPVHSERRPLQQRHVECACAGRTARMAARVTAIRGCRQAGGHGFGKQMGVATAPARASNGHRCLKRHVSPRTQPRPTRCGATGKPSRIIVSTYGDETSKAFLAIATSAIGGLPRRVVRLHKPKIKRSVPPPHATTSRSAFINAHCFSYSMIFATESTNASSLPKRESR